jgi:prepilin-type N-terminal cleavage/methylation domain-containing protein
MKFATASPSGACRARRSLTGQAGFTLAELLVATALSSTVLLSVMVLYGFANRSFACILNYAQMEQEAREAVDKMSLEVRRAKELTGSTATSLTFRDSDDRLLTYAYDAGRRVLERTKGGQTTVLARGIDTLSFSLFARVPTSDSYDLDMAASVDDCKLIQMNWEASRDVLGEIWNTKQVVMATLGMRRK